MQGSHQHLLHSVPAKAGRFPRILTLGGDHTITLPILRSIHSAYGPVSVIHFDSHLDSWKPGLLGMPGVTHGTYFYYAAQEGLLQKGASVHAGIRTPLTSIKDYEVKQKDQIFFYSSIPWNQVSLTLITIFRMTLKWALILSKPATSMS